MKNHVGEITVIPINELLHYKKNRNNHSAAQITRLAKLIKENGFRDPIKVDRATMEVIAGNGTLMALKKLGFKSVPCVLQDFESDEQKYAFSVSHNAIQEWSEIDMSKIHEDLPELQPFDLELLGLKNFKFEPPAMAPTDEPKKKECPECGHLF